MRVTIENQDGRPYTVVIQDGDEVFHFVRKDACDARVLQTCETPASSGTSGGARTPRTTRSEERVVSKKKSSERIEELEAVVNDLLRRITILERNQVPRGPVPAAPPWEIQTPPEPRKIPYTLPLGYPPPVRRIVDCGCPPNTLCNSVSCPRAVRITT